MVRNPTLVDELLQNTLNNPNKIALAEADRALTYLELWQSISIAAKKLLDKEIGEGDTVLLSLRNSINFLVLHFAILRINKKRLSIINHFCLERRQYL